MSGLAFCQYTNVIEVKCAICQGILPVDDVTCAQCLHVFHNRCITQYLIRCPLCCQPINRLTKIFFCESDGPSIEDAIETCKGDMVVYSQIYESYQKELHQLRCTKVLELKQQYDCIALSEELISCKNIRQIVGSRPEDIHKIILNHKNLNVVRAFATLIKIEGESTLAKEIEKTKEVETKYGEAVAELMKLMDKLKSSDVKIQDNKTKIAELKKKLVSHPLIGKLPTIAGSQSNQVKTNKRTKNTRAPRI